MILIGLPCKPGLWPTGGLHKCINILLQPMNILLNLKPQWNMNQSLFTLALDLQCLWCQIRIFLYLLIDVIIIASFVFLGKAGVLPIMVHITDAFQLVKFNQFTGMTFLLCSKHPTGPAYLLLVEIIKEAGLPSVGIEIEPKLQSCCLALHLILYQHAATSSRFPINCWCIFKS